MKCPKCGTEFEGKFCPECGEAAAEEKNCPQCGAKVAGSAKFCNECGYAFTPAQPKSAPSAAPAPTPAPAAVPANRKWKGIVYRICAVLPEALMALFSALAFAFFAAPVMGMKENIFFTGVAVGNVYNALGLKEFPSLRDPAIAFLVFACLEVPFAALWAWKGRGKTGCRVCGGLLYLTHLIIAACMMGAIAKLDEGAGLLKAGAAPVLMMVFAILFALGSAGGAALCALWKGDAEVKQAQAAREEAQKARQQAKEEARKEFYRTHKKPTLPAKPTKKQRAEYLRQKYCYKHTKESAPAAVVWVAMHKIAIITVALLMIVMTVVLSVVIPIASNRFRIGVVEKIELGADRARVEKILGDPFEEEEASAWHWYDKRLTSYMKRSEKLAKQHEEAFSKGDLAAAEKLQTEMEELAAKVERETFAVIEVTFEDDKVTSVLLDKGYASEPAEKKVKTDKVENVFKNVFAFDNALSGTRDTTFTSSFHTSEMICTTQFTDGSYYRAHVQGASVSGDQIVWTDRYSRHSVPLEGNYNLHGGAIGTISANGALEINHRYSVVWEAQKEISAILIPEGTTSIGENAFAEFTALKSVALPDSITSIGASAFANCSSLTDITIPDSITSIGASAFANCSSLTDITIPDSVTEIGGNIFGDCSSLTSVALPDSITSIGASAFTDCSSLTDITIPDSITSIGAGAFTNCSSLAGIILPNSVTEIGTYAFSGCSSLTDITLPDSVTSIGYFAFEGCTSLTTIHYQGKVEEWKQLIENASNEFRSYTILCTDGKIVRGETIMD